MTALFQLLDQLIPTLPGWGDVEKAKRLAAIVLAIRPDVSVEIGVYGGRSFFGLALAHKEIGHGTAIGIDPWSNEAAVEGYEGENRTFWKNNPINSIYDTFISHIDKLSVRNVTHIIRARSEEAMLANESIDLLHIDGQHDAHALMDVNKFATRVRVGGFTVTDDTEWSNRGNDRPVRAAEFRLLELGFVRLYALGTGAVFQRIR